MPHCVPCWLLAKRHGLLPALRPGMQPVHHAHGRVRVHCMPVDIGSAIPFERQLHNILPLGSIWFKRDWSVHSMRFELR